MGGALPSQNGAMRGVPWTSIIRLKIMLKVTDVKVRVWAENYQVLACRCKWRTVESIHKPSYYSWRRSCKVTKGFKNHGLFDGLWNQWRAVLSSVEEVLKEWKHRHLLTGLLMDRRSYSRSVLSVIDYDPTEVISWGSNHDSRSRTIILNHEPWNYRWKLKDTWPIKSTLRSNSNHPRSVVSNHGLWGTYASKVSYFI